MGDNAKNGPKLETVPTSIFKKEALIQKSQPNTASLRIIRSNTPEVEVPIEKTATIIGRDPIKADIVLPDERVSRIHAILNLSESYFILEDQNSKNGISFQGRRVKRLNLMDGDEFLIGETKFIFHLLTSGSQKT